MQLGVRWLGFQLLAVLTLTSVASHLAEGRYTPWNWLFVLLAPLLIALLTNTGAAGRILMSLLMVLWSFAVLTANVVLFGWFD